MIKEGNLDRGERHFLPLPPIGEMTPVIERLEGELGTKGELREYFVSNRRVHLAALLVSMAQILIKRESEADRTSAAEGKMRDFIFYLLDDVVDINFAREFWPVALAQARADKARTNDGR
jgi:hypothetical protein